MANQTEQIYFLDDSGDIEEFAFKMGDPIRLFKWGDLFKGGKKFTIAPGQGWKLPKFKAPIKMGSHDAKTPAGGWLTRLYDGDDGLYAVPEFNDAGQEAITNKSFRYHSPEVVWGGNYIEDADSGDQIAGPLIVGIALTHTPHLGENAALYSYQISNEVTKMTNQIETVEVPKDWFESVKGWFRKDPDPEPQETGIDPEKFQAMSAELESYKNQVDAFEAEKAQTEKFALLQSKFQTDEFGTAFRQLADDQDAITVLSGMTPEQQEWVIKHLSALSAQAQAVESELGADDQPLEGVDGFNAAIQKYMDDHEGTQYSQAVQIVAQTNPDLYAAYKASIPGRVQS